MTNFSCFVRLIWLSASMSLSVIKIYCDGISIVHMVVRHCPPSPLLSHWHLLLLVAGINANYLRECHNKFLPSSAGSSAVSLVSECDAGLLHCCCCFICCLPHHGSILLRSFPHFRCFTFCCIMDSDCFPLVLCIAECDAGLVSECDAGFLGA